MRQQIMSGGNSKDANSNELFSLAMGIVSAAWGVTQIAGNTKSGREANQYNLYNAPEG